MARIRFQIDKGGTVKYILSLFLFWPAVLLAQGPEGPKQTIQQIKSANKPVSFTDWFSTFGQSIEGQILLWTWAILIGAMVMSYVTKWAFKVIDKRCGPVDYFFRQDPQRTFGAFIGAYGVIAGGAFTGAFSNDAGEFVGWFNVVYTTLMAGMASDGAINKASRAAWSEEERKIRADGK